MDVRVNQAGEFEHMADSFPHPSPLPKGEERGKA